MQRRQRLFCAYAPEDEALRARLEVHLSVLTREGLIEARHDGRIAPGAEWSTEVRRRLDVAGVVLLLVSADFLASSGGW